MTSQSTAFAATESKRLPMIAAALMGLSLLFVVGVAQGSTLHGAAHDVRHSTGFPCH